MVKQLRDGDAVQREGCTHHWRIASPSGETSTGVCRICGATREFQNYAYRSSHKPLRSPAAGNRAASR